MLEVDALIVGGGPTGLALANALGRDGVRVLLAEQDPGVAELPRSVSVDDETMRFVQSLGLLDEARRIVLPGTGTKFYGARGQLLVYARGPERARYGHPVKNPMDHSEFQQMLLDGLARFDAVEVKHNTRFTGFDPDENGLVATLEAAGESLRVRAEFLIGADGGRSPVRALIGEEPMSGSAFEQRWLVVDTINDWHTERYAMHHGDPRRPRVVVVGRDGRCRYEFLVHEDELPEEQELYSFAARLIAPYRELPRTDVVRCTIYRFYALVADSFARDRAFLVGDAAHMMPPFAGQGLNSGLRDAANLAWKLSRVIHGRAGPELLDTYTVERRPHVSATVKLSVRMGAVMMTRSRACAWARDLAFLALCRLPRLRRFFTEMRFRPPALHADGFSVDVGADAVAGTMLVQPAVLDNHCRVVPLDEVLGLGFAMIGVEVPPSVLSSMSSPLWERLAVTRVHVVLGDHLAINSADQTSVAELHGELSDQLGRVRGRVVLVRPDRFIVGSFAPSDELAFSSKVEAMLGQPAAPNAAAPEVPESVPARAALA